MTGSMFNIEFSDMSKELDNYSLAGFAHGREPWEVDRNQQETRAVFLFDRTEGEAIPLLTNSIAIAGLASGYTLPDGAPIEIIEKGQIWLTYVPAHRFELVDAVVKNAIATSST